MAMDGQDGSAPEDEIRLLGALEIVVGGVDLEIRSQRSRALLALLAVNAPHQVGLDRIVEVLWDDPPESARQQVHNVVSRTRRALAGSDGRLDIVTRGSNYRLHAAPDNIDLLRFRRGLEAAAAAESAGDQDGAEELLAAALGLWRGPALAEFDNHRLASIATGLTEQWLVATERLFESRLRHGVPAGLIIELFDLVARWPFRERLRALLMDALHQSGRTAEALEVFAAGRRILAEELGLDPGRRLVEAQRRILRAEPEPSAAPPAPTPTAAAFLPRDIAEFTGRSAEISQLTATIAAAEGKAVAISAINGMGGIGKTALAIHVAHRLTEVHPDGQYFIDLHGFTAARSAQSPMQALGHLLQMTGLRPETLPVDLEGRSALWRARLAGKRVVLVLDNASDAAQIRPLLPGTPGAFVLISSRRRMSSLEGVESLFLDVLDADDSAALFARIVGADRAAAEPEAVRTVVGLCGHLPLAIQVAAARLRDRPGRRIAELADELSDQDRRGRTLAIGDRDVMAVLSWSFRQLTPLQQRVFVHVGIQPGPDFDAHTAAAITGVPVDVAEDCLEALLEMNLLVQRGDGRYEFHDLVHDAAGRLREQIMDAEEVRAAEVRLLDYYLASTAAWCAQLGGSRFYLIEPELTGPEPTIRTAASPQDAMAHLDANYRSIVIAAARAAAIGADQHAWQLPCALLAYFSKTNYGAEAEGLLAGAAATARALGHHRGAAICTAGHGYALKARGAVDEAGSAAAESVELAARAHDRPLEMYLRLGVGIMALDGFRLEQSRAGFTGALELARMIGDRYAEASSLHNLGVVARSAGDLDLAVARFREALAFQAEVGDRLPWRTAFMNLGQVLFLRREHEEAARQLQTALSLRETDPVGHVQTLATLCSLHGACGRYTEALACGREALELARALELTSPEAAALSALGDTYVRLGDLETAETVFTQLTALSGHPGAEKYAAWALEGQAHIHAGRGDLAAARRHWEKAVAFGNRGVLHLAGAEGHLAAQNRGATCWRCESTV